MDEASQEVSRADKNYIDNKREVSKRQKKRRSKMRTGLDRDESIRKEVVGILEL